MFRKIYINIQLIKSKIEYLQDNAVSTNYGIVHPNIWTSNEIEIYKIGYKKLKYIQVGSELFNKSYIIFGIKILKTIIIVKLRIILPAPNMENNEIDNKTEQIFEFQNKSYKYFKYLQISTHCVIKNNYKLL